jgi:hypothetical protein
MLFFSSSAIWQLWSCLTRCPKFCENAIFHRTRKGAAILLSLLSQQKKKKGWRERQSTASLLIVT